MKASFEEWMKDLELALEIITLMLLGILIGVGALCFARFF